MTVKTRFAPSPTGFLHVGGARTALYSCLHAKNKGGEFVLRIEDTDIERSTQAAVDAILEGMAWMGLTWDEGPYYQTKRFDRYKALVSKLIDEGKAYKCYCTKDRVNDLRAAQEAAGESPRYDGKCRDLAPVENDAPFVVRFKNSKEGVVAFDDHVRGHIEFSNTELDDLIIQRTDGTPTYNFCVVVDDWDMGITDVVRGEDHINNTPRQINIYHALGAPVPSFAHCAMILGDDGAKLSKRHGAVSVMQYRDEGYLPEALKNYLVRLGWSHGDQEVFSIDEMIQLFDLKDVNKAPGSFNQDKLLWLNQEYIKTADIAHLIEQLDWHLNSQAIDISNGPDVVKVIDALRERSKTLVEMAQGMKMFYQAFDRFDEKSASKQFKPAAEPIIKALIAHYSQLEDWSSVAIHDVVKTVCVEQGVGFGKVGQPFRLALSGTGNAGSIDVVAELVGKERTLARLKLALNYIAQIDS